MRYVIHRLHNINAVPKYYNDVHRDIEAGKMCKKTKYYFNFSIEEYEMLMYLTEQQQDIFSLLRGYYEKKELRPFGNYLQEKFPEIGMTAFMERLYQEASEKMKEMFFAE